VVVLEGGPEPMTYGTTDTRCGWNGYKPSSRNVRHTHVRETSRRVESLHVLKKMIIFVSTQLRRFSWLCERHEIWHSDGRVYSHCSIVGYYIMYLVDTQEWFGRTYVTYYIAVHPRSHISKYGGTWQRYLYSSYCKVYCIFIPKMR